MKLAMKKSIRLIAQFTLLALWSTVAFAHTEVNSTTPENGAVLADVPSHVIMTFANQIRLTRVQVTHDNEASIDLDLENQKNFSTRFEFPISDMGDGIYRIEWRGLAGDGHPMRGRFEFQVN